MDNPLADLDRWSESSGEVGDQIYLIRARTKLDRFRNSGHYQYRMDVIFEYGIPGESGMPGPEQKTLMAEVEASLSEVLERDFQSVLSGVMTSSGQREWYWYTRDPEVFMERFNKALADFGNLPLEIYKLEDPSWEEYGEMMSAMGIELD